MKKRTSIFVFAFSILLLNLLSAQNTTKYNSSGSSTSLEILKTLITPNDSLYSNQWGLIKIQAPQAWDITTGDTNLIIAILDSGIPLRNGSGSHRDFDYRIDLISCEYILL